MAATIHSPGARELQAFRLAAQTCSKWAWHVVIDAFLSVAYSARRVLEQRHVPAAHIERFIAALSRVRHTDSHVDFATVHAGTCDIACAAGVRPRPYAEACALFFAPTRSGSPVSHQHEQVAPDVVWSFLCQTKRKLHV